MIPYSSYVHEPNNIEGCCSQTFHSSTIVFDVELLVVVDDNDDDDDDYDDVVVDDDVDDDDVY